jgi:long-chain acyl-CoA synthetase
MVFGTGDRLSPTVTAAIFPDHDEMAKKLGYTKEADPQKYRDDVKKVLSEIVENVNASGMPYKAIKKLIIRNNEFEKTTTRKIKRNSPDNLNEEQES